MAVEARTHRKEVINVESINKGKKPQRKTSMDVLMIEGKTLLGWRIPPFQRPIRVNEKVRAISEQIAEDKGVIPGVITLGVIGEDPTTYIVDGQHRLEAFRMSELREGIADVRTVVFESMADMASEFVNLNSALVRIQPDDVLRGLEESCQGLRVIRERCPFVGYGNVRRGTAPHTVLSMSAVLRVWFGAGLESASPPGKSATQLASDLTTESAGHLTDFLTTAYEAWGRDADPRLWGALNLILCMWLWNRCVVDTTRRGNMRYTVLKRGQFKHGLMALGANADYCDWLKGRPCSERDRAPAYNRIKQIFAKRLKEEGMEAALRFPQPAWAVSK